MRLLMGRSVLCIVHTHISAYQEAWYDFFYILYFSILYTFMDDDAAQGYKTVSSPQLSLFTVAICLKPLELYDKLLL